MDNLLRVEDFPAANCAGVVRLTSLASASLQQNSSEIAGFAGVATFTQDRRYSDHVQRDRILAGAQKLTLESF